MKSLYLAALIGLFACQAVYAADAAPVAKAKTQAADAGWTKSRADLELVFDSFRPATR